MIPPINSKLPDIRFLHRDIEQPDINSRGYIESLRTLNLYLMPFWILSSY